MTSLKDHLIQSVLLMIIIIYGIQMTLIYRMFMK